MDILSQIGWVDAAMVAVLGISVIVGVIRGFVFELLSLAGWLAAWFAAQWFAPQAAPYIPVGSPGSALNLGAAFAGVFVAALIVWAIAARLIRLVIHATPLSIVDRGLGAVFGLLRGVVGFSGLQIAQPDAFTNRLSYSATLPSPWNSASVGFWKKKLP